MTGKQVGGTTNGPGGDAGAFNRSVIFNDVYAAKRAAGIVTTKRRGDRITQADRRLSRGTRDAIGERDVA
jgi:hypothetical protein